MIDVLARLRAWLPNRPERDRGGVANERVEPHADEQRIPTDVYLAQKTDKLPERVADELEERD